MPKYVNTKKLLGKLGPPVIGGSIVGLWYNIWTSEQILWIPFFLGLLCGILFIYWGDLD